MYFKISNGSIRNSRTPIEGGFEQNGLVYEYDVNRLVIVSDNEVRDMTQEEIDAVTPVDNLPSKKLAYKNARNAITNPETKAAFIALEGLLKEILGAMQDN